MKIIRLKTNHLENPMGYQLEAPMLSYVVEDARGQRQVTARIQIALDPEFRKLVSDESGDLNSLAYKVPFKPEPMTRYYWRVYVEDETKDHALSETAWFETAKEPGSSWQARWISPVLPEGDRHPVFRKHVEIRKKLAKARLYMTGLGLYELYIGGEKVGNEYFMPGYNAYDSWIQYQTYDVTDALSASGDIEVLLGNGWYKGIFGLDYKKNNYGDRFALLAELHLEYEDGSRELVTTDDTWKAYAGRILTSGIYDGEVYDATVSEEACSVETLDWGYELLQARLSPPITIHERITPVEVLHTPAGETVLDMGQNMVGWVEFFCDAPKGTVIEWKTGEILQKGCFYQENLRRAKSMYRYVSDGVPRRVRPHFTFYGFRYVLVEGWPGELETADFAGCVIHSDMEEIGCIKTSDPLVNQLFSNVRWGQKGNFLDVPTDCPQRDERMGWTGDAQIFSGTASYNMDTYAFYTKFGHDLYYEQQKLDGSVPFVVPMVKYPGDGSTAWGEAATVIPWQVYLHYGDATILEKQFDSMKAWVDYIERRDQASGTPGLWDSGFHFADWLALDGPVEGGVFGGTDPYFIASAYYCYSARLVAKAAHVLGRGEDEQHYQRIADRVCAAIQREYLTPGGRLAINTQTAHVVMLFMDLAPEEMRPRLASDLLNKLKDANYHLDTGFVGTPYLCRALSDHGYNEMAYQLLMVKDYPGWLYEVLMGATTVWERWNSVLPDGMISSTGMNSLNHYAYGSIAEWLYRNAAGICPLEDQPGFRHVLLKPQPAYQLQWLTAELQSASGRIVSSWKLESPTRLLVSFTVPFMSTATIVLPDADADELMKISGLAWKQEGTSAVCEVSAGYYEWTYTLQREYRKMYTIKSTVQELLANERTKEIVLKYIPGIEGDVAFAEEKAILEDLMNGPFSRIPGETVKRIDRELRDVTEV